ncbi:hypothetical protein DSO57_1021952 [Entomophthora muscae]|uniref:Uncharacterized protein n=1 Tax=Entomophthora muscae TaxID=34485 RepID=A0ACC2S5E2_9FUNG|nr:hypothetical protein DSO57_1021952 [Entomophthora muscae]
MKCCPDGFFVDGSCKVDWYRDFDAITNPTEKHSRSAFDILDSILPSGNEDPSRHDLPALVRWADTESKFEEYQNKVIPKTRDSFWE